MLELIGLVFGACALGIFILVFLGWILIGGANPETQMFQDNKNFKKFIEKYNEYEDNKK